MKRFDCRNLFFFLSFQMEDYGLQLHRVINSFFFFCHSKHVNGDNRASSVCLTAKDSMESEAIVRLKAHQTGKKTINSVNYN